MVHLAGGGAGLVVGVPGLRDVRHRGSDTHTHATRRRDLLARSPPPCANVHSLHIR